jgi:NADH-quinone oxidoreductase subunit J
MLIGSEQIELRASHRLWTPYVGVLLGLILVTSMIFAFTATPPGVTTPSAVQGGTPEVLGVTLFSRYILPFELAAVLLLVALLGALLVARQPIK